MMDPIQTSRTQSLDARYDWCAYRDPEHTPYGYGKTEAEAVADLLDIEDDEAQEGCRYCNEGRSHTRELCLRSGGEG